MATMTEQRFPYEKSRWTSNAEEARRWYEELERMTTEDVRAHLARYNSGSRGTVTIGAEPNMTKGFVEEWLAWQERRKAQREDGFPS